MIGATASTTFEEVTPTLMAEEIVLEFIEEDIFLYLPFFRTNHLEA